MSVDPYSAQVRQLFGAPVHAGILTQGTRIDHRGQGVHIELAARQSGNRIAELRFRAWGCPHVIAAAEAFCAGFEGRETGDLEQFSAAGLMQSLPVPVEKTGRILVIEDAVRQLALSLRDS